MLHDTLAPIPNPPQATGAHQGDADWSYTRYAQEVAQLRQEYERMAGRTERHTIGRDSSLLEGVYEGSYGGEAIVVDYDKDPELIDIAVAKVISGARDPETKEIDKGLILDSVFSVVSETMKYDSQVVDGIFNDVLGSKDGAKISLSYYIQSGAGECRHQALFAGTVLERLKQQGVVSGTASIDRNMVKSGADGKYDGHAWVRYTNSAGEIYIIDVAQQKISTLDELMAEHAKDPSSTWDYARPEDKQRAYGQVVTGALGIESPYKPEDYTNAEGIVDRLPWEK